MSFNLLVASLVLLLPLSALAQAEEDPYVVYLQDPDGVVFASLTPEFMEELRARVPPFHRNLPLGSVVEYAAHEEFRTRLEAFLAENGRRPSEAETRELGEGAYLRIFGASGGTRHALIEKEQRVAFQKAEREMEKMVGSVIATLACLPGVLYCIAGTAISVAIDTQERDNMIGLLDGSKRVDELSGFEKAEILSDTGGLLLPSAARALKPWASSVLRAVLRID